MNTPSQAQVRRAIAEAQTIVVKVGSSSLTEPSGHLDPQRLNALVAAIARVRLMGGRVVLVSSGAIAAGFGTQGHVTVKCSLHNFVVNLDIVQDGAEGGVAAVIGPVGVDDAHLGHGGVAVLFVAEIGLQGLEVI